MSIERMKRMWVVSARERLRPLLDFLASLKSVHLSHVTEGDEIEDVFQRQSADPAAVDLHITKLAHILDVMNHHQPPKRGLGENFVALPLEVTAQQFEAARGAFDVDELHEHITELSAEVSALSHRIEEIHIELAHLTVWGKLDPSAPSVFRRCLGVIGTASPRMRALMDESEKVGETVFINELGRAKDNRALLQIVALAEHEADYTDFLRQFEVAALPLPPGVSLGNMVRALKVELTGYEEAIDAIEADISGLVTKHRDDVTAVLGSYEMQRDVLTSQEKALGSKRMVMVTGYVRAREVEAPAGVLAVEFPEAGVTFAEPALEENVPVELRTSRFFEPAQALTSMFGLPHYRAFDPSPFVMFSFLLFFGFCFGDVVYGLMLMTLCWWIARKVKPYSGYHHFFTLLSWAGFSAMVVGAFTGTWAADLSDPKYLGEGNILHRIKMAIPHVDPLSVPIKALLVALGVGVINQFYGIILSMYRDIRLKDYAGAIFDGGLWLVALPGLIMMITALFSPPVPPWVSRVGVWVFLAGAVGLFLTQGRKEKGLVAKGIVGLVSIYGIIGSYGVTGFIGDTLSYSRLLALGLTTAIVGMCFNMIAGMFLGEGGDPAVWQIVAFALIVLVGHSFNFLINVLGSFVHSGRLIFMELFGRFYEAGGVRFTPLGTSDRVRVID